MEIVKEVISRLIKQFPDDNDIVKFEDERGDMRHFKLEVISNQFEGLNRVKRSQLVYGLVMDLMKDDHIHALKLNLKTHSECK